MRKLRQMPMPGVPVQIQAIFNEIFRASQDSDQSDIANAFSISGTFTPTRTLNVSSPTAANIAAVLATLIQDLQRGGQSKTT